MRFVNVIENVAGGRVRARVLTTLLSFPAKQWTGRQLALHARVSQPQAGFALDDLKREGLAQSVAVGNAKSWKLNQKHFLVKWLRPLARARVEMQEVLRRRLVKGLDMRQVEKVVLFGSVARGDETPESDIDLYIQVKSGSYAAKARKAALDIARDLVPVFGGNPVTPVVYTADKARQNHALLKEIARDGVVLYGDGVP
ncbi:MAG: nucleotidyltransferase domain-containing protein [Candidatus Micrarchaeota archaeon]